MIMFFIGALIAAGIGWGFIRARRSRLEKAEVYIGTILGCEEKYISRGHVMYKAVKPSVRYNNGRREVTAQFHDFIRKTDYHYNDVDEVEIRAYPELPKVFYFAKDDEHISYEAIVCFAAAAAFTVIGICAVMTFGW